MSCAAVVFLLVGQGVAKTNGASVCLAAAHLQIHDYLGDAAKNCDEVKNIPSVSKVILWQKKQQQYISHFNQRGSD